MLYLIPSIMDTTARKQSQIISYSEYKSMMQRQTDFEHGVILRAVNAVLKPVSYTHLDVYKRQF